MNWLFIEVNPKFYRPSLDFGPIGSIKLACKNFNSVWTHKKVHIMLRLMRNAY